MKFGIGRGNSLGVSMVTTVGVLSVLVTTPTGSTSAQTGSGGGSSWQTLNYPSPNYQNNEVGGSGGYVNTNSLEASSTGVKRDVGGSLTNIVTETPRKEGGGGAMYYYEMYPMMNSNSGGRQNRPGSYYEPSPSASNHIMPQYHSYSSPYVREGMDDSYGVPSTGSGWGMMDDDGGAGGGSASGLAGLIGLLGLKGLKGLKTLIAPLLLLLPFLPIIIPLLPILALLPLILLLFLPIPVIVVPNGRSFQVNPEFQARALKVGQAIPELASEVLGSEECVERISCEIARVSKNMNVNVTWWVDGLTSYLPKDSKYTEKILKGFQTLKHKKKESLRTVHVNPHDDQDPKNECVIYSCKAKSILAKHMSKINS